MPGVLCRFSAQFPNPDIPEADQISVILKLQGPFGGMRLVVRQFFMSGWTLQDLMVVLHHAIQQDRDVCGGDQLLLRIKHRSGPEDVESSPFTGFADGVGFRGV